MAWSERTAEPGASGTKKVGKNSWKICWSDKEGCKREQAERKKRGGKSWGTRERGIIRELAAEEQRGSKIRKRAGGEGEKELEHELERKRRKQQRDTSYKARERDKREAR